MMSWKTFLSKKYFWVFVVLALLVMLPLGIRFYGQRLLTVSAEGNQALSIPPVSPEVRVSQLSRIGVSDSKENSVLTLEMSEPTSYETQTDPARPEQIRLQIKGKMGSPVPPIPELSSHSLVAKLSLEEISTSEFRLIVEMQPFVSLHSLVASGTTPEQIRLWVMKTRPSENEVLETPAPGDAPLALKRPILLSLEEQAQQAFDVVKEEFDMGVPTAEKDLEVLLQKFPQYLSGWLLKIRHHLEKGETDQAQATIDVVSADFGKTPELASLQARLYLMKHELTHALAVLEEQSPDITSHPDFYFLKAGILLQLGRYPLSQNLYQELLKQDDKRGEYWLGLALSLAPQGDRSGAQRAYQKALLSEKLSPAVKAFIHRQLNAPKGR